MMKFLKDRGMRKNMIRAIFLIAFIWYASPAAITQSLEYNV